MTDARGLFVNFEGIDGTGKTTCLRAVAAALRAAGEDPVLTKLPGDEWAGSDIGARLRELLFFHPTTKAMAPGVADLLYLADQLQCTEKVIRPALEAGRAVLCDRYADSQAAYSAHPSRATPPWAAELYGRLSTLEPDLTFLFLLEPDIAWSRSKARGGAEAGKQDGKAWEGAQAQAVIQEAYLARLKGLPRTRLVYVEDRLPEDVAAEVAAEVATALAERRRPEWRPIHRNPNLEARR